MSAFCCTWQYSWLNLSVWCRDSSFFIKQMVQTRWRHSRRLPYLPSTNEVWGKVIFSQVCVGIGGSKGAPGTRPPPRGSKLFHFHAVFGKNLKNNSNFGVGAPPGENPGSATGQWFCPRWGSLYGVTSYLAAWSHVPSGGVFVSGPMFLPEVSLTEIPLDRGLPETPPPSTVKSGQYAFYWKCILIAILFRKNITKHRARFEVVIRKHH